MSEVMYFKDETGKELPLLMADAFEFDGQHYALFVTPEDQLQENEQPNLYVMRAIFNGDQIENFEMPSDEEMERVTPVIIERLEHQHSCGCGDSGCDCGCSSCGGHCGE